MGVEAPCLQGLLSQKLFGRCVSMQLRIYQLLAELCCWGSPPPSNLVGRCLVLGIGILRSPSCLWALPPSAGVFHWILPRASAPPPPPPRSHCSRLLNCQSFPLHAGCAAINNGQAPPPFLQLQVWEELLLAWLHAGSL